MSNDGFQLSEEEQKAYKQQVAEQKYAEQNNISQKTSQDLFMENIYDLHKFTTDPEIKDNKDFEMPEIDKNMVLGNFNKYDEVRIALCEDLLSDLDVLLPQKEIKGISKIRNAIRRDLLSTMTASRGRKGFAAKLLVTQITSGETKLETKKNGGLFSFK